MSTVLALNGSTPFDSRDCKTWSCPRAAEPGSELCSYCARQPPILPVSTDSVTKVRAEIQELLLALSRYELEITQGRDRHYALRELRTQMAKAATLVTALR